MRTYYLAFCAFLPLACKGPRAVSTAPVKEDMQEVPSSVEEAKTPPITEKSLGDYRLSCTTSVKGTPNSKVEVAVEEIKSLGEQDGKPMFTVACRTSWSCDWSYAFVDKQNVQTCSRRDDPMAICESHSGPFQNPPIVFFVRISKNRGEAPTEEDKKAACQPFANLKPDFLCQAELVSSEVPYERTEEFVKKVKEKIPNIRNMSWIQPYYETLYTRQECTMREKRPEPKAPVATPEQVAPPFVTPADHP